jgi:hypothetical protein
VISQSGYKITLKSFETPSIRGTWRWLGHTKTRFGFGVLFIGFDEFFPEKDCTFYIKLFCTTPEYIWRKRYFDSFN